MVGTKIIAGDLDTSRVSGYEQERGISKITIHPDWLGADVSFKNDVCLLTLDSPLELNDQVKRIELDDWTVDLNWTLPHNAICKVSGWGTLNVRKFAPFNLIVHYNTHVSAWWFSTKHLTMGVCIY